MGSFHELIAGFHNFQESYLLKEKEFFDQLAHGQKPKSLVIACCDSRVDPAILLGGKPGDLFVVRSIAALIPPVGLSSPRDAVMSACGQPTRSPDRVVAKRQHQHKGQ